MSVSLFNFTLDWFARTRVTQVEPTAGSASARSSTRSALGARLVPVRGRGWMSALLASVPLAASLAEARREMPEDLDVEPLDLEALEGDEGL